MDLYYLVKEWTDLLAARLDGVSQCWFGYFIILSAS